jgi:homoserine O-acetyltransferase/O-succinyltransferase
MTTSGDYWRPGDNPGPRHFVSLDGPGGAGFDFEGGGHVGEVVVAYETWGQLNAERSNAVLVEHALTGDSHAARTPGLPGAPGWWEGLIGPGLGVDTNEWFVVCSNVLGGAQGTTGPSSLDSSGRAYGSRFPVITVRDQVIVEVALADALGIERWFSVVGGSMGGMRSLEWTVGYPERVDRSVVLAVGAASTADEIAHSTLQIRAIRSDPAFHGGDYYDTGETPSAGLAIARGLGQITYRTGEEFEARFGRAAEKGGDALRDDIYAIESYLGYHGEKLARRFDANSYIVLSEAMNHHDVGRGRGGVLEVLRGITTPMTVIGIDSDRLYPLALQRQIADNVPSASPVAVVTSSVGHDGFLLEADQIGKIVKEALEG